MGSPSIYVFDCSGAGLIVHWFNQFAEQRAKEKADPHAAASSSNSISNSSLLSSSSTASGGGNSGALKDYILLAACAHDQILPMNPLYPADIFTACLTTPIKMALQWYIPLSFIHIFPVKKSLRMGWDKVLLAFVSKGGERGPY